MAEGKGHPLPASGEARHDEIPDSVASEKGVGQDPEAVTARHPTAVAPDGRPYDARPPGAERVGRSEPEPGP